MKSGEIDYTQIDFLPPRGTLYVEFSGLCFVGRGGQQTGIQELELKASRVENLLGCLENRKGSTFMVPKDLRAVSREAENCRYKAAHPRRNQKTCGSRQSFQRVREAYSALARAFEKFQTYISHQVEESYQPFPPPRIDFGALYQEFGLTTPASQEVIQETLAHGNNTGLFTANGKISRAYKEGIIQLGLEGCFIALATTGRLTYHGRKRA